MLVQRLQSSEQIRSCLTTFINIPSRERRKYLSYLKTYQEELVAALPSHLSCFSISPLAYPPYDYLQAADAHLGDYRMQGLRMWISQYIGEGCEIVLWRREHETEQDTLL